MPLRGDEPRKQQAPQTHSSHEGAEENPERHRRGADDELDQLEPDNLIDQCRAATSHEQHEQQRQEAMGWWKRQWDVERMRLACSLFGHDSTSRKTADGSVLSL